jgi:transcriptional regulator with AAA-type ATPase domain
MPRKRQLDVVFEPIMRSTTMRRLDRTLRTVAPRDVTVTLVGESGTGKEVLAHRIHEFSERRRAPFIPINCAAIPEALFESEIFGHERGAFTGANERVRGKIEAAEGGTLFLDEIGEMPLGMQAKLLRFLENRRFMRVGGTAKIQADVRLVFATLRDLEHEVRAGRFRADLYYRIQGITVHVPPLRERKADLPPLIAQVTAQMSARHGTAPPKLGRAAKLALLGYACPGNVRELRNTLELLCLLRAGMAVRVRDLPDAVRSALPRPAEHVPATTLTVSLDEPLGEVIDRVVEAALALEHGNRSRAAERLGVSVRTVQRHLARGPRARRGLTARASASSPMLADERPEHAVEVGARDDLHPVLGLDPHPPLRLDASAHPGPQPIGARGGVLDEVVARGDRPPEAMVRDDDRAHRGLGEAALDAQQIAREARGRQLDRRVVALGAVVDVLGERVEEVEAVEALPRDPGRVGDGEARVAAPEASREPRGLVDERLALLDAEEARIGEARGRRQAELPRAAADVEDRPGAVARERRAGLHGDGDRRPVLTGAPPRLLRQEAVEVVVVRERVAERGVPRHRRRLWPDPCHGVVARGFRHLRGRALQERKGRR